MQSRLNNAGVRPINNMVDITNYVMLEYGQPLHAYDRSRLAGGHLVARRAKPGEKVETIDHVVRELTADMLVITDDSGAVGVAGVMGGVASEVSDDTTTILLESANFEMRSIRHTRQALKLRTEASARFERGLDPNLASKAAARALSLMLELCPGAKVSAWQDVYPNPVQPRHLTMPFNTIERVLGIGYPEAQVTEVLWRLELQPMLSGPSDNRTLTVTVRTDRQDLHIPEEIVEEVARIIGYDTLPETLLSGRTPAVSRDPIAEFERDLRSELAAAGAWECIPYPLVSASMLHGLAGSRDQPDQAVGLLRPKPLAELIRVVNPLQADRPYLRTSLVPSLLEVAVENRKHEAGVRLFEIAPIYIPNGRDELPTELPTLAMVFAGQRERRDRFGQPGMLDYFDLKAALDLILDRLEVAADARFARSERIPAGLHPGRASELTIKHQLIGILGELRPDVATQYGFNGERVIVAELDLEALRSVLPPRLRQVTVSHYLSVEQDFAIVVDEEVPAADVERALMAGAGPFAKRSILFDIFQGPQLGEGKKSLAYRVTFEAPDRALTDAELVKTRSRIEKVLKHEVGGVLRA
jgi:phenylalanyl-tRNA synthetase beta chain